MNPQHHLFRNEYYSVSLFTDTPIVLVVRSSKSFSSQQDAESASIAMLNVLDGLGRKNHYLLLDSRLAPGKSDPVYEQWFARIRMKLTAGYPRTAVLLKTIVGKLHTKRLLTKDDAISQAGVFLDMDEAIAFLEKAHRFSARPPPPKKPL